MVFKNKKIHFINDFVNFLLCFLYLVKNKMLKDLIRVAEVFFLS